MLSTAKKILFFIPLILLILVLVGAGILFGPQLLRAKAVEAYLEYQDQVDGLSISNTSGDPVGFANGEYKVLIFLSADCGSCIESLPLYDRFNRILCNDQNIELMLMWEDRLPLAQLRKHNLEDNSYSLGNVKIANAYGTVLFVSPDNHVEFMDSSGLKNVIAYVMEKNILKQDQTIENANVYLREKYGNQAGKKDLVYFSMPNCPDCIEATPIVYTEDMQAKYNITRIELDRGAKVGDIIDDHNIYRIAYGIDWYPSFLVLSEDRYSIIRRVEVGDLQSLLMDN
jgi:hypothetical protein